MSDPSGYQSPSCPCAKMRAAEASIRELTALTQQVRLTHSHDRLLQENAALRNELAALKAGIDALPNICAAAAKAYDEKVLELRTAYESAASARRGAYAAKHHALVQAAFISLTPSPVS